MLHKCTSPPSFVLEMNTVNFCQALVVRKQFGRKPNQSPTRESEHMSPILPFLLLKFSGGELAGFKMHTLTYKMIQKHNYKYKALSYMHWHNLSFTGGSSNSFYLCNMSVQVGLVVTVRNYASLSWMCLGYIWWGGYVNTLLESITRDRALRGKKVLRDSGHRVTRTAAEVQGWNS